MKTDKITCDKHPKYQAKRQPRCTCTKCWAMWIIKHPPDERAKALEPYLDKMYKYYCASRDAE